MPETAAPPEPGVVWRRVVEMAQSSRQMRTLLAGLALRGVEGDRVILVGEASIAGLAGARRVEIGALLARALGRAVEVVVEAGEGSEDAARAPLAGVAASGSASGEVAGVEGGAKGDASAEGPGTPGPAAASDGEHPLIKRALELFGPARG